MLTPYVDPSLSLSHYISTLVLLLPNRDLNSCANPEPQLKVLGYKIHKKRELNVSILCQY